MRDHCPEAPNAKAVSNLDPDCGCTHCMMSGIYADAMGGSDLCPWCDGTGYRAHVRAAVDHHDHVLGTIAGLSE